MTFMVVRVRGSIHARHDVTETLRYLHLTRANHATIIPEEPSYRGMLTAVQGYVTWGEADAETVGLLLRERGEATGGERITSENAATLLGGKDLGEASRIVTDAGIVTLHGLKPLFRLKAPRGGWKSTKKPFVRGGALGYRGRAVNDLVRRMV